MPKRLPLWLHSPHCAHGMYSKATMNDTNDNQSIDNGNGEAPREPTLITWYVNKHRALETLGPSVLSGHWHNQGAVANLLGPYVMRWMQQKGVPSLSRLAAKGEIRAGRFFFHDARFYSNGLNSENYDKPKDVKLWFPMKEIAPERIDKLEVIFNTQNLTTVSAFGALQGSPVVFVCGAITKVTPGLIEARPLVIGHLVEDYGCFFPNYSDALEMWVSGFDAFSKIDFNEQVTLGQLGKLKDIPEETIKRTFAEAMSQPFVDKDWGGETGDLFSSNAMVDGKQISCGFMFKGPAKFKKLQPGDCGKNGDQVIRLFEYPASCFVLQHCHDVAPTVRKMMRAFAVEKLPERVRYCIIDGRSTYLILKKLGQL